MTVPFPLPDPPKQLIRIVFHFINGGGLLDVAGVEDFVIDADTDVIEVYGPNQGWLASVNLQQVTHWRTM